MLDGESSTTHPAAHRRPPRVVVVMPAYNEEGLPEFLAELERHLGPVVSRLEFIVVDDASSIPVADVVVATGAEPTASVQTVRNETNVGHGPTALRAYRRGLATDADLVLHVDGDGQFLGPDVAELVTHLWASPDSVGAVGVRTGRTDPWFRKVLTRCARTLVTTGSGWVRDANTPLRVYRREAIALLLDRVDPMATVPHLQFSILERRLGLPMRELDVTHRVRRGDSEVGTTWQRRGALVQLPSRRLMAFSARAAREVLDCMRGSQLHAEIQPQIVSREVAA